jgi:hypothetical protein
VPGAPPRTGLLVLGGVLTLVSVLFYIIGVKYAFGLESTSWISALDFAAEGVAAGLLLATRRPRWADLLVGLLAWEWVSGMDILHYQFRASIHGWGYLLVGSATGATALLCLVIGVWRRPQRSWATRGRWVFAAVLAVVGFFASGLVLTLLFEANYLDPGYKTPLQFLASILCGLALPGVLLARPTPSATTLAAVGWFLTGAQLAAIGTAAMGDHISEDAVWMWVFVVATTALAVVAAVAAGRRAPDTGPSPTAIGSN